ncbi:MAG: aminotransferase class I/II-fold pyridoxal phosphate-dependent enzyme [Lachnospiraceae bacterium]|nr:aminotransferase class I/II-fold pyridoxal phosphate-dependent enzyme [Lachnospiraceae bacterium]
MKTYQEMSKEELQATYAELQKQFEVEKAKGLQLDMSRGKPCSEQLDTVMPMMDVLTSKDLLQSEDGYDCRNYGTLYGIMEARQLIGDMIGAKAEQVIVMGNASLNIMFDTVERSMTQGVCGGIPWARLDRVKFLCPAPGYDRHFKICQYFGIEMITIPMHEDGPDMDLVEKYVSSDPAVKGIWCVPKYSNPQGYTYSDETVRRFANLKPAAGDFRIYWDNAYCIHDLYEDRSDSLLNILTECEKAGNPNLVFEFCSTSKISFAGAGIAAVATSKENLEWIRQGMTIQTIGYDKINQLRHVKYYKNIDGIKEQMKKHAASMRPKFEAVKEVMERELAPLGIGTWTNPNGGYFISFDSLPGCAKKIVAKCKEAGVILTDAGATFPYGVDPMDTNIRIAPSYPTAEEMAQATDLFVLCVKLVSVEKLLKKAMAA